jgi:hypothetical protein
MPINEYSKSMDALPGMISMPATGAVCGRRSFFSFFMNIRLIDGKHFLMRVDHPGAHQTEEVSAAPKSRGRDPQRTLLWAQRAKSQGRCGTPKRR